MFHMYKVCDALSSSLEWQAQHAKDISEAALLRNVWCPLAAM